MNNMIIHKIKLLATNPHLFVFNSNDRYVNKTCDEIIWSSPSNHLHIIYHDRTRFPTTPINQIEGIRIINEYTNK